VQPCNHAKHHTISGRTDFISSRIHEPASFFSVVCLLPALLESFRTKGIRGERVAEPEVPRQTSCKAMTGLPSALLPRTAPRALRLECEYDLAAGNPYHFHQLL